MATPAVDSTGASTFAGASDTRVLTGEINTSQGDHIRATVIFNIGTSNLDTSRDTLGVSETSRPGPVRNTSSDQEQEVHSNVRASNSDASRATLVASGATRPGSVRNTPSDQEQSPILEDSSVSADSGFSSDTSLDIAPPKEDNPLEKEPSYAIYQRHMYLEKHGFPLWIPQPNMRLSLPYRRQGVSIGDVGIFTSNGGFDFLFNICLPAGHPSNPDELPEGFSRLHLKPADVCEFRAHSSHSHMASFCIQKQGSATFECSNPDGAILIMPQGAYDEDLRNISRFRDYALTHAESWYEYANGPCGREVGNKELHLVTGCDKTTSWGIATYSHLQSKPLENRVTSLNFNAVGNGRQGRHSLYPTYSWDCEGTVEARVGPEDDELMDLLEDRDSAPLRNQCTFIRSITLALGDGWKRVQLKVAASAEARSSVSLSPKNPVTSKLDAISPLPGLIDDLSGVGTSRLADSLTPAQTAVAHPATYVIDMLLQKCPRAKVIVVHDSDWCSVIRDSDEDWRSTSQDLQYRIPEAFDIVEDENGAVYLQERGRSSQQLNTSSHFSVKSEDKDLNSQASYYGQWQPSGTVPQLTPAYPFYDLHERYSPQPSYGYSFRSSPPAMCNPSDSRRLPPLTSSSPGGDRWQQSDYGIPTTHVSPTTIRSPTAFYPTTYAPYPDSDQTSSSSYMPTDEHHSMGVAPTASPTSPEEPKIQKKRKHADAATLKVLNETYNRTAFPSTEERHALAKALDMSVRSIQIWFQNKRQSKRQTNRQSSTVGSAHQSFTTANQTEPLLDELPSSGYWGSSIPMPETPYLTVSRREPIISRSQSSQSSSHRPLGNQEEVPNEPRR